MKWQKFFSWSTVEHAQRIANDKFLGVQRHFLLEDKFKNARKMTQGGFGGLKGNNLYWNFTAKANGVWKTIQKNEYVGNLAKKSEDSYKWAAEKSAQKVKDIQKLEAFGKVSHTTKDAWKTFSKNDLGEKISDAGLDAKEFVSKKSSQVYDRLKSGKMTGKTMGNLKDLDSKWKNEKKDLNNRHKFSELPIEGEIFRSDQWIKEVLAPVKSVEKNWWQHYRMQSLYESWKSYWEGRFGRIIYGVLGTYWQRNGQNFAFILICAVAAYAFFYGVGQGMGKQLAKIMIEKGMMGGSTDQKPHNTPMDLQREEDFRRERTHPHDSVYRIDTRVDEI